MGALNESKVVEGNAILTLTIAGWAKTSRGKPLSVRLTRQDPPAVVPVAAWRGQVLPNGPPARPVSKLPPEGSNELVVSVIEAIGAGRCGTVLAVDSLRMTNSQDPSVKLLYPQPPHLPELVIKIADPEHEEALKNEAAIYSEMELLQGVSIPRSYGIFTAELEADAVIPSLEGRDETTSPARLSVLLLERLGDSLPLGDHIPEEGDLWDVFRDLARLGIEQTDIRYSNILHAPTSPSSLPGKVCPFHGCVHTYRVLDFDNARKTDLTLKSHYYNTLSYLGPILEMMRYNTILEPWDIKGNTNRSTAL